jgi:hypothetical protein
MKKIFFIYFLIINLSVFAQEASLTVNHDNNTITASLELKSYNIEEVLDSLNKGFEAEIFFEFRLYEKATGFLSFFGDKLIVEEKPFYIAGIDIFEKNIYMNTETGDEYTYNTEKDFIENFFKVSSFVFDDVVLEADKDYYILGRIQLNHVKLIPPLDLISLFSSTGIITDWVEIPVDRK